jgi:hypothetical protein
VLVELHEGSTSVELPLGSARVVLGAEEDVRSPGQPRYARLTLAAHAAPHFTIVEEGAVTERIAADLLSTTQLDRLVAATTEAQATHTLLAVRQEIARAEQAQVRLGELEQQSAELEQALQRARDNLAALGKASAPTASQAQGQRLVTLDEALSRVKKERDAVLEVAKRSRKWLLLAHP